MRHIVSLRLIIALLIMGLLWSGRSMASLACDQPGFQDGRNIAVGQNPVSIVRVDFNRDGQPDMAVANSGSDDVSILLADSKGVFVAPTNFAVAKVPERL